MQMSRPKLVVGFLLCITWFHGVILSPTTQAQVSHSIPRGFLKKRQSPQNATRQPTPFVRRYDWQQQEFVQAHNDLRLPLGVPPLVWDQKLASHAHSWAMERQEDCNHRQHSRGPFGENIFWMQYNEFTPTDVVRKWFSERPLFDHVRNRCKCQPETEGCECGHYTSIIWKTTQRVGCSSPVYCAHGKGLVVVCNYDPPGNHLGMNPLNPRH